MASLWNHTPPGDGLKEYFGWVRSVDGPTLTDFFNKMAVYGDIGYQDRLCVNGTSHNAHFSMTFLENGKADDIPTVYINFDVGNVNGSGITTHRNTYVPRPDREAGESFQSLTVRWLCSAYTKLLEFDTEFDKPFNFDPTCPVRDSEVTPTGLGPNNMLQSLGIALLKWEPPTVTPPSEPAPWVSVEGTHSLNSVDHLTVASVGIRFATGSLTSTPTFPASNAFGLQAVYDTFDGVATVNNPGQLLLTVGQDSVTVNGVTAQLPFVIERRSLVGLIVNSDLDFLVVNGVKVDIDLSTASMPTSPSFGPFNGYLRRIRAYDSITLMDALTVTDNWKS